MSLIKAEVIKIVRNICVKNRQTPCINIQYTKEIDMLESMVFEGRIILNISNNAILNFYIDHENISFQMGVNKLPLNVIIPIKLISAIYPREDISDIIYFPVVVSSIEDIVPKTLTEIPVKKHNTLRIVK